MTVENSTEIPSPPILYGAHSKPGKAPGRFQNFLGLLVGPMLRTPGLEDGYFFMNTFMGVTGVVWLIWRLVLLN